MRGAEPPELPETSELLGLWRLVSYHDEDAEGAVSEGPLGPQPHGLLYYADGYLSVNMGRGTPVPGAVPYMGYAGTWRREGDRLVHVIEVCSNPAWSGTEQTRTFALDGDLLTLRGTAVVAGRAQQRVLTWKRA
ncbi:lipocalin-like domain-containing protein [Streptomyces swartbergensis]|uniref:lipocalin-like domain-containing protein n=1 Tax=Streptomyces swartbergensis TaxID=487165 RepID=UPI00381EC405